MIKTNVDFLEGRLLSNQLKQSEKFSKKLIGWKKAGPPKKPLFFVYMIKTKVAFLEGQIFFSQSGLFENFSGLFWLDG